MAAFIVAPKNRGLKEYRKVALSLLKNPGKIIDARGEDVPFLVNELSKNGKKAIGLTGEDLFLEYCLKTANCSLKILKRIEWNDTRAMFGKPTLCLLGSEFGSLDSMPRNAKICIASKYREIAEKYLSNFKGYNFKKTYLNGSSEMGYSEGLADFLIDIVYTGKSIGKAGLKVYSRIIESDFVIIGGKND